MHIHRHETAAAFLDRAAPWLSLSEAANNLVLGIARARRDSVADGDYWVTVEAGSDVMGCAFRTPPHRLGVTTLPAEAVDALVEHCGGVYDAVPGVGGPAADAERFARAWSRRLGVRWRVRTRLRLHMLTEVVFPGRPAPGELRPIRVREAGLIRRWSRDFVRDTGVVDDPEKIAEQLLRSDRTFVWDHGGPRSLVAAARETPRGASVNAVFTPVQHRGRGYASTAVASLSHRLLASGYEFCCLYTDVSNPTSNSIYARLGYVPVLDCLDIDFSAKRD